MIDGGKAKAQNANEEVSILVMSNTAEELRTAQEQLGGEHGVVRYTDQDGDFVRIFNEGRPRLLVLSFSEIPMAERAYLMMYRQCPSIHHGHHLTLLLCKSNEAAAAHSLCVSGTFEDYLVNRPLHDPHRVDWSVRQLLARCDVMRHSSSLNQQLAAVGSDVRRIDERLTPSLRRGIETHEESARAVHELSGRLQGHLERFEARLADPSMQDAIGVVDPDILRQQLRSLHRESLEPEIQAVAGKIKAATGQVRAIEEEFRSQVSNLKSRPYPAPMPEILLVDDDEFYREMVVDALETNGMRVWAVDSGEAALDELRQHRPHAILLDYLMPGIDGLEVLRQIRRDAETRDVPVLMLTGLSEKQVVKDALAVGVTGFIVKPSDRDTILDKVRGCLPDF